MKKVLTRPRKNGSFIRRQHSLSKRICRALMGIVFAPFILSNMLGIYLLRKIVPHSYRSISLFCWSTYSAIVGYLVGMLLFVELVNIISLLAVMMMKDVKRKKRMTRRARVCGRKRQAGGRQAEGEEEERERENKRWRRRDFLSILYA